jgi:L-cysteine/cystine lyase
MTFEDVRDAFPVLERFAYLNAGTFGPVPTPVAEAVAERRRLDLELGRSGPPYVDWVLAARKRVRARLAAEIGVDEAKVALTRATTDGCNVVLAGLGLGPEDEVVTTDAEHFGLVGALGASEARIRVAPVGGRAGEEALETILAEVGPRTRLIALSHVLWTTGNVMPVGELKERTGRPLLVDGAQSVGAIPVDAGPFDYYTVSGQKWLCGPDATGALYVADPESLKVAFPSFFSKQDFEPDGTYTPAPGAARFDNGWLASGLLAGLEAALAFHPEWRFERAAETARRCRERLAERVEVVTARAQANLVTWRADGIPEEIAARAYDRGVVIRDLPGTGLLRASCGYWTSDEDIERLIEALAFTA